MKMLSTNRHPQYKNICENLTDTTIFLQQSIQSKSTTTATNIKVSSYRSYIKIRSDNKLILGNNSLAEYLSQRLECNIDQANYIISRVPALKGKSAKKMNEIIDYLYSLGIKPFHICITPKILLHSVETMKKRVEELQEHGIYIDNLRLLIKSKKQYQVYYNKLIITNKKKLRSIK